MSKRKKATITTLVAIVMVASSVIVVHQAFASTYSSQTKWTKTRQAGEPDFSGVFGTVQDINGTTITLIGENGTTYTVDISHAAVRTGSSTSTMAISDIKIGDQLIIKGTMSGASVTATSITDGHSKRRRA